MVRDIQALPFACGQDSISSVSPHIARPCFIHAYFPTPFYLSAANSGFVDLTKWNFSLLEIYFQPQWECILLGKLMVQISLLEARLDYLEECSQGIGLVAVHTCQ